LHGNAGDRGGPGDSPVFFEVENRDVQAGEIFTVRFNTSEPVQGWQFTLELDGLEVTDILDHEYAGKPNFGVFADALTTSVDGAGAREFAVQFRAIRPGMLSRMLGVSDRITRAEAYDVKNNRRQVSLRFGSSASPATGSTDFKLYQNQPNPFSSRTTIGFTLPEDTNATLSIFDENGLLLQQDTAHYGHGYHEIAVDAAQLGTSGVLYYKLETPEHCAVRKMVRLAGE
jgi:hypothetical protein